MIAAEIKILKHSARHIAMYNECVFPVSCVILDIVGAVDTLSMRIVGGLSPCILRFRGRRLILRDMYGKDLQFSKPQ